ncbi:MAG: hypothetical protein L3J32_01870 [Rhizobiaceae bacterium]|nr:hypothetical protein [Rhizobiaceae bacterium]
MKLIISTALLLMGLTQPGFAEPCEEKFTRLLVNGNIKDGVPVKTFVVSKVSGKIMSTNNFYWYDVGHWMTEMIQPWDRVA